MKTVTAAVFIICRPAIVTIGTLPGVLIGAFVWMACLPNPMHFKLSAAIVLFHIGFKMLLDLIKSALPGIHDFPFKACPGFTHITASQNCCSPIGLHLLPELQQEGLPILKVIRPWKK